MKCNTYYYNRPATALVLACLSLPTGAVEFKPGDGVEGKVNATVTAGTMIRMGSPDPDLYGALAGALVGRSAGQLAGNGGGSDLNFQRGRPVSTVLKGVADIELKRQNLGFFARAMAWNDFELKNGNRAYGNSPNRFTQNVPLSDNGFAPEAKFSNARLADVYAFGRATVGLDTTLDVRVGRQVLNWGVSQFVAGGINGINPLNLPAQQRPGALPQEGKIPVGMISANLASGKDWGAEGFIQYEFLPSVLPGCGTFFMTPNYVPTGCNYVSVLPTINDPTALATGRYPKRSPDAVARDSGQFGLSLRYAVGGLNTDVRAYAMNYHNRMPSIRVTNANVAGGYGSLATLTRLTDPDGVKYASVYAEDIRLYGLSFDTKLDATMRIFGEIAYRPNQPLNVNPADLIAAFLTRSPTTALVLAKNTNAIAPGGIFDAYDRFKVATASLGANKVSANTWGAERLILSGELGLSHVAGLPDAARLRYGRSELYGVAAVNGFPCADTSAAQKSCAHDGFITSNAWGYRARLSAIYPGTFFGGTLTPSLTLVHDVSGYSYDGTFLKDRKVLSPAIRASWGKKYFAEMQYTRFSGGAYFTLADRENLTLVVGINF
ncbi:MAG: DUF1302 domain-containing protein [Proteobacteria bacterium]|nr:DUF1302 domain-containing protein [Pseudomonadota bacterium]